MKKIDGIYLKLDRNTTYTAQLLFKCIEEIFEQKP